MYCWSHFQVFLTQKLREAKVNCREREGGREGGGEGEKGRRDVGYGISCHTDCSMILCQLIEVLASYQVSHSDLRKLFLKLQGSKDNLVNYDTHCSRHGFKYI